MAARSRKASPSPKASDPAARLAQFEMVLKTISKLSGLRVSMHDLTGFSSHAGKRLLERKLYSHNHPFCRRIKKREGKESRCYREDALIAARKAGRIRKPFVKGCHAGVLELVVPVLLGGNHAGTIFVGPAVERGKKLPRAHQVPVRSKAELLELGQLLTVVAGYAAQAGEALVLQELDRGVRSDAVRRSLQLVARRYATPLTVDEVARHVFLSASRFAHVFSEEMGVPFHEYLTRIRIERAKDLLALSSLPIGEVSARTGFCHQNYFANVFRRHAGMTPTKYRQQQQKSLDI